jgi:hypothetical protein
VAVTVSFPVGAFLAVHEPDPPERAAVQSVAEPAVKVTLPVGVPVEPLVASATVAW